MAERVLRTWDEWKALGYHIMRGQRACGFNDDEVAVFSDLQVEKTAPKVPKVRKSYYDSLAYRNSPAYREPEPLREEERKVVYFADGSGYLEAGGPCGPLYFDRNGNT